ncbi:MAG TPA: KH domain-containing protein [Xenococcaceae cyanobacterium]|jgi:hypothetical protein
MSQHSPSTSASLSSAWGKFANEPAATATKSQLEAAGIASENITLEAEDFIPPVPLEDTQAIANLQTGAIAGGVMGFLIGLSISLVVTDFANLGLAALGNFQTIHYFAPLMGAIVGAAGISLISASSGASVPKSDTNIEERPKSTRYLVVVKGTPEETNLAREIIAQQGGVVEEADR